MIKKMKYIFIEQKMNKNINNFSFISFFKENFVWIIIFACLIFFTYVNSINNDFVSDDIAGIVNKNIESFNYVLKEPNLIQLDYFLRFKLGGFNPAVFRFFNILTHFCCVILVFIIIFIFINKRTAIFSSFLFSVHSVLTEAVSWIAGSQYLSYSFFFLLSFLFYILSKQNKRYYIFSLIAFFISLAFTEKGFTLFLIFIVYSLLYGNIKKDFKKLIPFIVLGLVFFISGYLSLGPRIEKLSIIYEKPQMLNPFVQIPIAITSYLELIFWPDKLTLYHSEMSFSSINFTIRVIIFMGLIIGWIYSYIKNKKLFFWLSLFFISLAPFLTPFGISWIVAERYVYLGSIGLFAIIAMFLDKILSYKKYNQLVYTIFIAIIISLSIRTIIRNIDWKNEDNLWIATAKTSPSSPNTHNNLGDVYGRRGDLENAAKEFKKAIEIKPNYADAYHNLANTYRDMGNFEEAIKNYNKALSINPYLWQSYQAIAGINFYKQEYNDAIKNLNNAIKINSKNEDLKLSLAMVYFRIGKTVSAEKIINEIIFYNPNNTKAKELLLQINKNIN